MWLLPHRITTWHCDSLAAERKWQKWHSHFGDSKAVLGMAALGQVSLQLYFLFLLEKVCQGLWLEPALQDCSGQCLRRDCHPYCLSLPFSVFLKVDLDIQWSVFCFGSKSWKRRGRESREAMIYLMVLIGPQAHPLTPALDVGFCPNPPAPYGCNGGSTKVEANPED